MLCCFRARKQSASAVKVGRVLAGRREGLKPRRRPRWERCVFASMGEQARARLTPAEFSPAGAWV
eukprot:3350866-Lingulodinium_polyedra.AAC.1